MQKEIILNLLKQEQNADLREAIHSVLFWDDLVDTRSSDTARRIKDAEIMGKRLMLIGTELITLIAAKGITAADLEVAKPQDSAA